MDKSMLSSFFLTRSVVLMVDFVHSGFCLLSDMLLSVSLIIESSF